MIVILGDCQTNGNNCLAHEITGQSTELHTWSLRYHKRFPQALKWMIANISRTGTSVINTGDAEQYVWKYVREQEMAVSWPAKLPLKVSNYSVNGAHFLGYIRRIKSHIAKYGNPHLVIITDYFGTHKSSYVTDNGTKFYIEKELYTDKDRNEQYPQRVHDIFVKRIQYQLGKPRSWWLRRHMLAYRQLVKFLDNNNIQHINVSFVDHFESFFNVDVNCRDLYNAYTLIGGEDSKIKYNTQQLIADRIMEYINENLPDWPRRLPCK